MLNNVKYPVVAVVFIATLSLLFAGQWLYFNFYFKNPLSEEIQKIAAVEQYKILNTPRGRQLQIYLNEVEDLKETYLSIESIPGIAENKDEIEIVLVDKSDKRLKSIWEIIQFSVYEAIKQGEYTEMVATVKDLSQKAGLDKCRIQIDGRNLYLQLHKEGKYLYRIIPLNTDPIKE